MNEPRPGGDAPPGSGQGSEEMAQFLRELRGASARLLLDRLGVMVDVLGGCTVAGVCLAGQWAMADPAEEPPPTTACAALVGRPVGVPVAIARDAAGWAAMFPFGSPDPGALLVTAPQEPTPRTLTLLRSVADGLDAIGLAGVAGSGESEGGSPQSDPPQRRPEERRSPTERRRVAVDELASIQRAFTSAVVDKEGLDDLAVAAAQVLDRRVVIWTADGDTLGSSGPMSNVVVPDLHGLFADAETGAHAKHVRRSDWVLAPIAVAEVVGVLGVEDEQRTCGERETMIIELAVATAALEIYRQASLASVELQLWGDLTNAMLFDTNREHVHRYAQVLHYDIDEPHRLAVVEPGVPAAEALPIVRRTCRELGLPALVGQYDDHVVVVFASSHAWSELGAALRRQPRLSSLRMGVTKEWPSANDTAEMRREAELALRVGHLVRSAPVICFEDLGILQLLSALHDPDSMDRFVRDRIGALIDNDAKRGSDFVKTLSVYLDLGGALDPAAEALFIHRSTLKYRLGRIRELLGVNLSEPERRFELQLACRVHSMMAALRPPAGS